MNRDPAREVRVRRFWKLRYSIVLSGIGAVGLLFLLQDHRAHLLEALPYLFLLACPLMHLFMHRGHAGHRGDRARRSDDQAGSA